MKNVKEALGILVILFSITSYLYSQDIGQGEFMIVNKTNSIPITVKIYPVGAIFSGGGQYTVDARFPIDGNPVNKHIYPHLPIVLDYN